MLNTTITGPQTKYEADLTLNYITFDSYIFFIYATA